MTEAMRTTRCLLCSLTCPLAFDVDRYNGHGQVLTEYAAEDALTQGRLCFRGHYLAEMAAHPYRLTCAELRGDGSVPGDSADEAIAALASSLQKAGKHAAIVVDGNLLTEDIVSALQFARDVVHTELAAVYLPESDAAMLWGIRPGTVMVAFADVHACDALLAVGDVLATHPVISRPLLEARAARKLRLFGVDCMPNRVAGFAERFLRVKPGGEAAVLAGLCKLMGREIPTGNVWAECRSAKELAEMAGVGESDLEAIADALSQAKRPALLLDPVPGRMMNVAAASAMASALCHSGGPGLMPMFCYGNAVGAARAAAGVGAVPLAEVVEAAKGARVEVLLTMGVDLLRMLPVAEAFDLRARIPTLAAASAFRNRTTEGANIVLPLTAFFEEAGGVFDTAGTRLDLEPLLSPPGGAMSARALCVRLASAAGASLPEAGETALGEAFLGRACAEIELRDSPAHGVQLVARADTADFDTGSLSRILTWPRFREPIPELHMNAADAKARGLTPRSRVLVRANASESCARLRIRGDVPRGMAAVSTAFVETRSLFQRRDLAPDGTELTWSEADVSTETE